MPHAKINIYDQNNVLIENLKKTLTIANRNLNPNFLVKNENLGSKYRTDAYLKANLCIKTDI